MKPSDRTGKAPAFQWYPKDCDTDEHVRAMDDREFGFYMRCLNHSWLNGGLPADMTELSRVMGRPKGYVGRLWVRVGRCFVERDGRFVNEKQEAQRTTAREFIESRREAAKIKWQMHKQSTCNARALHVECSASASPSASAIQDQNPCASDDARLFDSPPEPTPKTDPRETWFAQWWEIYWLHRAKKPARKAFMSAVKTEERFQKVMAATRQQRPEMMKREPSLRPHGATWLNGERWEDELEMKVTRVASEADSGAYINGLSSEEYMRRIGGQV